MVQQKIVIKMQVRCDKCRCKALEIAAVADGVISAAWEGEDKDKVVVMGDGVDAATLTRNLSKKLGFADLLFKQVHNVNHVHHLHLSINCTSNIM
ncbi:hypothetical protein EZV62_009377 [Acer yangbiense]|uniref:HMA domain-containing protein n=1 Tax=Acer yangbiense TaxID=1000413 RepID=A0A5C7IH06_9ROSI|nr:hypothetical protein EZV62_009377 [Acer yangbiense]